MQHLVEPARVLVVDDCHLDRHLLRRDLQAAGYHVQAVATAEAAREVLRSDNGIDLVLLDLVLPGVTGLELLRWLRERWSQVELPVIIVSGDRQDATVVRTLDEGANDYVAKPLNMAVVLARVRVQLNHLALEHSLQERNQELEEVRDRLQHDIDAAARIQKTLLPAQLPQSSCCRYVCFNQPCATVGGDIANIIGLSERFRGVYLIDVSGHGVQAALLAVSLYHLLVANTDSPLLDMDGWEPVPPLEVARRLNARFQISRENLQYFTMCYGLLDEESGRFDYVLAGHPPPLVVRAGGRIEQHEGTSMPVGMLTEAEFTTGWVDFATGDRLYLYSDGITEAEDPEHVVYGVERLGRRLAGMRDLPLEHGVEQLLTDVRRWCGDEPQADDYSLVAMEFKGLASGA